MRSGQLSSRGAVSLDDILNLLLDLSNLGEDQRVLFVTFGMEHREDVDGLVPAVLAG